MSVRSRADTEARVKLDPERRGYLLEGTLRKGFQDDPSMEVADRLRVARWARQLDPDRMSQEQRELLVSPEGLPKVSRSQRELARNQEELASRYLGELYRLLDEPQKGLVAEPGGEGYPLSVGDMHRLTNQSERQIRKWADDGLLPSFREGGGRRFYSAALIRAFVLSGASSPEKALLRQAARGELGHFLLLCAATFGRAAEDLPASAAEGLSELASGLTRSTELMGDLDPRCMIAWGHLVRERVQAREAMQPDAVIWTVPRGDRCWVVEMKGVKHPLGVHQTKVEANREGRAVARELGALYRLMKRDGTIAEEKSYARA
jgi:hypothetical protein